jgi:hypothetical protein
MIVLSTRELLGMLGDALPFVATDKDDVAHTCVRVEWAPEQERLFISATCRSMAGRTWWDQDTEDSDEMPYGVDYGQPGFSLRIPVLAVKSIVTTFKLTPDKLAYAPLSLSVVDDSVTSNLYRLKIERAAAPDLWPALKLYISGRGAPIVEAGDPAEVNIHDVIDTAVRAAGVHLTDQLAFGPKVLAAFGKVERHGVLRMEATSERDGAAVLFSGGTRFQGVANQARLDGAR